MKKRVFSMFLVLVMLFSLVSTFNLTAFAGVSYSEDTIIISLDENGIPQNASETGWEYDSDEEVLTLQKGHSFAVDGECNVAVTNLGTIVGGTYNKTVNNTGSTNNMKEQGGVIENGIFNGDVNNYHGWNTCTINNGTFNGKVTLGNHGVINNGKFLGDFEMKLGYTINAATFKIEFEANGGNWSKSYTAPTTYNYSTSAGIKLPTADDISKDNVIFYGWYSDADFSGDAIIEIPAKAAGKLTYYARYVDSDATWQLIGEQAVLDTDYAVDSNGNYRIFTAKGLAKLANVVNGGDSLEGKIIILENNIDLLNGGVTGYSAASVNDLNSWIPIDGFAGTFDGNGKEISNLYISSQNKKAGLFGYSKGTIKNLTIKSGSIEVTSSLSDAVLVGAIASVNAGVIENCVNLIDVSVEGAVYAGGIAGETNTSDKHVKISDCKNYGKISSTKGNNYLGGIVGYQFSGFYTNYTVTVENCINEENISGMFNTGGISGTVKNQAATTSSLVRNCMNKGIIVGDKAGGITGYSERGYVYNSYNFGTVTGGKYGGGIVGFNYYSIAEIANCYNAGTVTATGDKGAVAGRISYGKAYNCYYLSDDEITAAGQLANKGSATDCLSFTAAEGGYTLADTVYDTTDLLTALNVWVTQKNDSNYSSWITDSKNSNYPIFVKKIKISKEDKSVYYGENTYDVSQLFGIDSNAGKATYTLTDGGTGEGTLEETMLTVTKVGTFHIRVTTAVNGVYAAGSMDATLTVLPKTVTATIETIPDQTYTGSAIEPVIKVYDGTTEIPASEYEVVYSENINVGIATVTLKNKDNGNYIVSGSATFKINKAVQPVPSEPTATPEDRVVTDTSPTTGDSGNIWRWFAIVLLSGGGLLGTIVYRRKKKYFTE